MREINIIYIDDKPDPNLSRYLDADFSDPEFHKNYQEILFNPAEGYESLIKNPLVQTANIIIIDSMLFENSNSVSGKFSGEEFKIIIPLKILQFPALTLCNSANGGKALIFRRFRHLPFGRVVRISRRIPA